ncbi:hypothetical protein [Gimesia fumaroli]|uniref:Uncharacterized protein n=1 Tax=Gimesia fumaroli TaxID=2527976 RepID=A0A518IAY4_9PLAN|nr:hypothetical protein [Gimesia fumaroli]QDV50271.1 hypothetical protein Enr17x_23090 [Gimesia fumaroli]
MFNDGHGTILKYVWEFYFADGAPRLSEISGKMTEITSLPVRGTGRDTVEPVEFSTDLSFECVSDVKVHLYTHNSQQRNTESDRFSVERGQFIKLKGTKTDSTLLWTTILALEALGGVDTSANLDEDRSERGRKQRQKYNYRISEAELLKRHRKTRFWSRVLFLILILLSPVLLLWMICLSLWEGIRK